MISELYSLESADLDDIQAIKYMLFGFDMRKVKEVSRHTGKSKDAVIVKYAGESSKGEEMMAEVFWNGYARVYKNGECEYSGDTELPTEIIRRGDA
jgi:hypothetical protein